MFMYLWLFAKKKYTIIITFLVSCKELQIERVQFRRTSSSDTAWPRWKHCSFLERGQWKHDKLSTAMELAWQTLSGVPWMQCRMAGILYNQSSPQNLTAKWSHMASAVQARLRQFIPALAVNVNMMCIPDRAAAVLLILLTMFYVSLAWYLRISNVTPSYSGVAWK